jgi:hypothetical protein
MGIFRKSKAAKLKRKEAQLDSETPSPQTPASDKFDPTHGFNELRAGTPQELKGSKVDNVLSQYHKKEDHQKLKGTGRRPSVEERMMKDAYHAGLVNGGVVVSSDDEVQAPSASEPVKEESSNNEETQAPVTDADSSKLKVFHMLCGRQDPESRYFTRRLMRVPDAIMYLGEESSSSKPSYSHFDNTAVHPDATELYRHWQQNGSIPTHCRDVDFNPSDIDPKYTWIASWPLMNAAIQGQELRDENFIDRVMNLLAEKVKKGVHPDPDTIAQLFGDHSKYVPDVLKRFGVDGLEDMDSYDHPPLFLSAALTKALQRTLNDRQSSSLSSCEYHSHATPKECYKSSSMTQETWQEHLRHEELCQSLISTATTSQQKDVTNVEQQDRDAAAHQEMRNRTGKPWVGFRRLDKQMEKLDECASSPESPVVLSGVIPPCLPEEAPKAPLESSVFGTTQTEGAVDDVGIAPPTREPPPPPPVLAEVQEPTPIASHELLPAYDDESYVPLRNGSPTIIGQADGSYSLPLSVENAQSKPGVELQAAPSVKLGSEKRVMCPGAFPESRPGSLRSITSD